MVSKEVNILLLEGKRTDQPSFYAGLTRKGFEVKVVPNGSRALEELRESLPDIVLINAASMRTSGKRICKSIQNESPDLPVILIVDENITDLDSLEADIVLALPFTLQKLLNRMRLVLPVDESSLIIAGPIKLDVENRWVRCNEKQTRLTPRLVHLLKELMDHPGEVYERESLFSLVWETGYTGDTRTLDVHISWLRQAVEDDPRHPKYIKTVRGVGYRLDVDAYDIPHGSKRK